MRFSRSRELLALSGALVVLGIVAYAWRHPQVAPDPHKAPEITHDASGDIVIEQGAPILGALTVLPVETVLAPHTLHYPGVVVAEPRRTLPILTPLAGRVLSVSVVPGQHVKRGDVLAVIASGDLAQAVSDRSKAYAALTLAQRAFTRAQGVLAIGGNAVRDLDSARNDLAQAQAEATRTDQRLAALDALPPYSAQGHVALVAPADGTVSGVSIAPGTIVTDPTAVLMNMVDLDVVWVNAMIPEDAIGVVAPGEDVRVQVASRAIGPVAGRIATVDPVLQADTRRLQAHVACPNPDGVLRPNMYADVAIDVPQAAEAVVPQSALLMFNDATYVFVEVAPRTFHRQAVRVSYDEGDSVRILSGLTAGQHIVTIGGILLNDD